MATTITKKIFNLLLALFAGAILPFAFAPYDNWLLTYISIGILAILWNKSDAYANFVSGFVFGLGFFGVGVSWVFVSINTYGNTNELLAGIFTLLFVSILALFPAIQGYILARLYGCKSIKLIFGLPASWVIFEWLRTFLWTGFPWLYLGYSHLDTPIAGFAPIVGIYGTSWLIALQACLMVLAFTAKNKIRSGCCSILTICIIWSGGYFCNQINWTHSQDDKINIAMIQGNISPDHKFLLANPLKTVWNIYGTPTMEHLNQDLVIWPENSLPLPEKNFTAILEPIIKAAETNNTTLIFGSPTLSEDNERYYNSLHMRGNATATYHKTRLVPFGEFLPLRNILHGVINFFAIPMSNFKPGPIEQQPLITPKATLLPLICYEVAYPQAVRQSQQQHNADVILTVSEDGWFGDSIGPHQHLQIARMRALETGRHLLRATTSGISAVIDAKGKIVTKSPQFAHFVLTGKFTKMSGVTPWIRIGQWPILGVMFSLFVLGIFIRVWRK